MPNCHCTRCCRSIDVSLPHFSCSSGMLVSTACVTWLSVDIGQCLVWSIGLKSQVLIYTCSCPSSIDAWQQEPLRHLDTHSQNPCLLARTRPKKVTPAPAYISVNTYTKHQMRLSPLQVCIGAFASAAGATTVTDNAAFVSNKTFDFVIAGAGLSGITVANKVRVIPLTCRACSDRTCRLNGNRYSSAARAIPCF